MKNKLFKIIVILLFILNVFLLFYKLGCIPRGIHVDEAGSYYDALSLIKYGVDRHLYKNPVYFINYGGGMNALYTYLACLSFKMFGDSIWSFRLVAVIINLISYYFYYKLILRYKNKFCSLICLLLLTIFPIFIMKARWGLESYLLCPMLIISMYYYYMAINERKNIYFVITGFLFGITLYTYAISYLIIFLFIVFSIIYLLIIRKISIKNIFSMCIPLGILALPLILMILVNKGIIKNEIITFAFSIPKLWEYRGGEISLVNFKYFISNFAVYFKNDFLGYNYLSGFGTMYLYSFSIIFIVIGFIISIVRIFINRNDYFNVLIFVLFLIILFICSIIHDLNINKANAIYFCFVYFIILSFEWFYNKKLKVLLAICLIVYLFNFVSFDKHYFGVENRNRINVFFEDLSIFDAIDYANSISSSGNYIFMDMRESYIYILLDKKIDPYTFNNNAIIYKDQKQVFGYDHYRFAPFSSYNDKNIYIYNIDSWFVDGYIINGFKKKEIGNYVVLFK